MTGLSIGIACLMPIFCVGKPSITLCGTRSLLFSQQERHCSPKDQGVVRQFYFGTTFFNGQPMHYSLVNSCPPWPPGLIWWKTQHDDRGNCDFPTSDVRLPKGCCQPLSTIENHFSSLLLLLTKVVLDYTMVVEH